MVFSTAALESWPFFPVSDLQPTITQHTVRCPLPVLVFGHLVVAMAGTPMRAMQGPIPVSEDGSSGHSVTWVGLQLGVKRSNRKAVELAFGSL